MADAATKPHDDPLAEIESELSREQANRAQRWDDLVSRYAADPASVAQEELDDILRSPEDLERFRRDVEREQELAGLARELLRQPEIAKKLSRAASEYQKVKKDAEEKKRALDKAVEKANRELGHIRQESRELERTRRRLRDLLSPEELSRLRELQERHGRLKADIRDARQEIRDLEKTVSRPDWEQRHQEQIQAISEQIQELRREQDRGRTKESRIARLEETLAGLKAQDPGERLEEQREILEALQEQLDATQAAERQFYLQLAGDPK